MKLWLRQAPRVGRAAQRRLGRSAHYLSGAKLLGDDARAMAAMNFSALAEAPEFEIKEVTRIGADLRIIAAPKG